jgi:hypothetical protein
VLSRLLSSIRPIIRSKEIKIRHTRATARGWRNGRIDVWGVTIIFITVVV